MQLPVEQVIAVGGQQYRLSKFTLELYQEYLIWAKSVLPDPFDGLAERIKGLSPDLQRYAYDKAEAKAKVRGTMNDPDVQELMKSVDGIKKLFHLLFRKHHPELSESQVATIIEKGVQEHGPDLFDGCFQEGGGVTPAE